jgi:hypothetical protein
MDWTTAKSRFQTFMTTGSSNSNYYAPGLKKKGRVICTKPPESQHLNTSPLSPILMQLLGHGFVQSRETQADVSPVRQQSCKHPVTLP